MKPKTIFITGATKGIGRETVVHLIKAGHRVFGAGRDVNDLNQLSAEFNSESFFGVVMDVTKPDEIAAAVERVSDQGGLDVLINNAGYSQLGPVSEVSPDDIRRQLETNVVGLVAVTQAFLPLLRTGEGGVIINVSSILGRFAMPFQGVYCASKHAVEALSDAMRMENAPWGIDVVVIEPGPIKTTFGASATKALQRDAKDDSPYRPIYERIPELASTMLKDAPGPEVVAKQIADVVHARKRKPRYVVPGSSKRRLGMMLRLPTSMTDKIKSRMFGLEGLG